MTENSEEFRQDMLVENYNDTQHKIKLRTDLDYALEYLDSHRIVIQLEDLSIQLSKLGHKLTAKELIEYLL